MKRLGYVPAGKKFRIAGRYGYPIPAFQDATGCGCRDLRCVNICFLGFLNALTQWKIAIFHVDVLQDIVSQHPTNRLAIAKNDQLTCVFDRLKPAPVQFNEKPLPPDIPINVAQRATDDTSISCSFSAKQICHPIFGRDCSVSGHVHTVDLVWLNPS